jgi:hypothetical protein
MLWLWISLGVVGALVVIPFLVGSFLPERYQARVRLTMARSADDVWQALSDHRAHPLSGKQCRKVEDVAGEGLPVWVEDLGQTRVTVRTVEAARPTRLAWTAADSVVPLTARWDVDIESEGEGCVVSAASEMVVRRGTWHVPLFRFILWLTGGGKKALVDRFRAVGRTLNAPPNWKAPAGASH